IGLSVSFFSLFLRFLLPYQFIIVRYYLPLLIGYYPVIQTVFIQIGYVFNWIGVLVLLTLGTLSGALGFKFLK
ncbi:MAG: hypothetical protein QXO71_03495, partial [Candidatus Jordarchaeaceae archaeon]